MADRLRRTFRPAARASLRPLGLGVRTAPDSHDLGGDGWLVQSEEAAAFHTFFDLSTDPMLCLDPDHRIVEINAAGCRFLHSSVEALHEVSALEVERLARLLSAGSILQRLKSDPPPVVEEVTIADSEGQPLQCRIQAMSLAGERTLLWLTDTTPVLRARDAQHESERMLSALFDSIPPVVWTMALPEERLLDVSASSERLFGHQPAAFRHHPDLWDQLVTPAERERVRGEFRRGIASARPFEIAFTGLHRDHRDLPNLVNRVIPVADAHGWVDRCIGMIEDRSIQVALDEALRDTRANLRHILESVASGVLVVKPGTHGPEVVICNRHLVEMLRLDSAPRLGTPLAQTSPDLQAIAHGPRSAADFEQHVLSDETRDEVAELAEPHRVLRRYTSPLRDAFGIVVGRIVTVEDVTSSWLLQRRLTHAQKMESIGRIAGGVAHDFNNLLGTVLGFSSMLLEETPGNDPRREPLGQIAHAAERASRLTAALLAFSRSARFERLPVSLNRTIEDAYQLLRSTLDPSVAVGMSLDPGLPMILGDALLLQQVVVNLVQEVREDLHGGSQLRVATRVLEPQPSAATEDAQLQTLVALEVEVLGPEGSDAGPPPVDMALDRGGLALTIAEDIVRAHGGYLVTERVGNRARFRAMLPCTATENTMSWMPETATARGHETILVVDDEAGLRLLARNGLQQRGFEVLTAEDGEQGLEILRSPDVAVDAVLLDLSMPGISGERVLRTIRGFDPDLPVIIASGYATVESQSAWHAAGAMAFIAKPYRIQELAARLREVLDRAKGRAR